MVTANKKRIAILGGGLGACTAAYWLTSFDGWENEYEITIYQMGWRLGGKGASGRAMKPGYGKRIQEHGLHIWFGFYDNAFRMMRDALQELGSLPEPPVATFKTVEEAFTPQSLVTIEENWQGQWIHWPLLFPQNADQPGLGAELSPWNQVVELIAWIRESTDAFFAEHPEFETHALNAQATQHRTLLPAWAQHQLLALRSEADAGARALIHDAEALARSLESDPVRHDHEHHSIIAGMIRLFLDGLWLLLRNHLDDTLVRRAFIGADLAGSSAVGILRERLLIRGFEAADDMDISAWLAQQGAKEVTVTSAPVNVIYDLVFGFDRGDTNRPDFAAGTWLRGVLRMMFTYKGSFMFKMMSGMGDTIFTPLYGLLRKRGVHFEFFHKVEALELNEAKDAIAKVRMTKQVELTEHAEREGYWPLTRVKNLDCWPDEPDWSQIADAAALQNDPYNPGQPYNLESYYTAWRGIGTRTLELNRDFDEVVLGIPVDALRFIATELIDASDAFAAMTREVKTVQTQGIQLWLSRTTSELGFKNPPWARDPSMGLDAVLGAYAQPIDTWADMTHLLPTEDWPASETPRSVAYFCGPLKEPNREPPLSDHGYPRAALADAQKAGLAWFDENLGYLWPEGTSPAHPKGLDPALLIDPSGGQGVARYDAQWWRVNIDPPERYTLSVKGSTGHRLRAHQTDFSNLYLCGDWTYNGVLNAGCVEASVASGMEAARAICGHPGKIIGSSNE